MKACGASCNCVFCQIVQGNAPASIVHTDNLCLSFLTLRQTRPGELLIIPREHIDHFYDLPEHVASHIIIQSQRISRAIMKALKPPRVGLVLHGFTIPHAHLIVVPQHDVADITSARYAFIEDQVIKFDESRLPIVPRPSLDALAKRLRESL